MFLDFETTGLGTRRKDEIVEIGIVDASGAIIMEQLVHPVERKTWKSAQKIHGISPEDVARSPTFDELKGNLVAAIFGKDVAIYNAPFDLRFIPPAIRAAANSYICVMQLFRSLIATRYRLSDALEWAGVDPCASHRAVEDAIGALHVWNALEERQKAHFDKAVRRFRRR